MIYKKQILSSFGYGIINNVKGIRKLKKMNWRSYLIFKKFT